MNKTIDKCNCGKDIEQYSTKYVTDPMTQEFSCRECWQASREKKEAETMTCARCGKTLNCKCFGERRFCLAKDKDGKYGWNIFCISCEPYQEMAEKH